MKKIDNERPSKPNVVPLPKLQSAWRHTGSSDVEPHVHDATELVFVSKGDTEVQIVNQHFKGKTGMLYIHPANIPHNLKCRGRRDLICVLFYHAKLFMDERARVLDVRSDIQLQRWLEDLSALHCAKIKTPENIADSLLLAVLHKINDLEQQGFAMESLHPRIAAAVQFIHANLTRDLAAETIAKAAGASYSHLSRLFLAHFRCAPLKFQQRLRMEMAQKLLLNPYTNLSEVAEEVGYADLNYFCRLFRNIHGISPGQWRKKMSGG